MSYPKKIARLRPIRGLAADVPAYEIDEGFASLMTNVLVRNAQVCRGPARREAYATPLATPEFVINTRAQGVNWWLYASESAIHAVETTNHHDVTPTGGILATQPWQWSGTRLNGIPILHNQQDAPFYWGFDPGTPMQPLPGWPAGTVARNIVAFRYHLFALGIDTGGGQFPLQLRWSDAAEPGTVPASWTPAADNEAGDTELSDTPGPIVTAVPMRGSLAIYKPFASYICDYVGGDEKFGFQLLNASDGALSARGVAAIDGGRHVVVGDGDIYMTDGASTRSIANLRVRRFMFDNLNRERSDLVQAIYYRAQREVWVLFPEQNENECTAALVWNQAEDAWGYVPLPRSLHAALGYVNDTDNSQKWDDLSSTVWNDMAEPWNAGAFASPEEKLVLTGGANLYVIDEGSEVSSGVWRRDGLALGQPERVKFVRRLHIRVQDAPDLTVRIGGSMTTDGYAYSAALPVTNGYVNCTVQGKYLSVIVEGSSAWKFSGLELEVELRGYH